MADNYRCPRELGITGTVFSSFLSYQVGTEEQRKEMGEDFLIQKSGFNPSMEPRLTDHILRCGRCRVEYQVYFLIAATVAEGDEEAEERIEKLRKTLISFNLK